MRAATLALSSLCIASLLVLFGAIPAEAQGFGDVGRVNKLLSVIDTPQLAPGERGSFRFEFNSTYDEPIVDVTLRAEIYMYATIEEAIPVDGNWSYPYPQIEESPGARSHTWNLGTVPPRTASALNFTVATAADSRDMPHGSVFSQATYFVRFRVEFEGNVTGTLTPFVMASPGYFTRAQWEAARNLTNTDPCVPPWCRGNVNLTILGVDGIVPDSSFGVKEPIPQWPFYALVAGAVGFLVFAFLFWVEENPGAYPRVEVWWARTRGRLARLRPVRRRTRTREKGF
ncbi:MAG: hypothetical protein ACT4OI_00130 [Methanobacteriota archaeon]